MSVEVSNGGEDSESSEEGEGGVTKGDTESVSNDRLLLGVVGSVRGHDSHAYTNGEEDLSAGIGPHVSVSELGTEIWRVSFSVSSLKVHADTGIGVLEGETLEDHDENEEARERDGDPDNIGGGFDTLEYAEVDNGPGSEGAKPYLPLEFRSLLEVLVSTNEVGGVYGGAVIGVEAENVLVEVSIVIAVKFEFCLLMTYSSEMKRSGQVL